MNNETFEQTAVRITNELFFEGMGPTIFQYVDFANRIKAELEKGASEPVGWLISDFIPPLITASNCFNEAYKLAGRTVSPAFLRANLPPSEQEELERLREEVVLLKASIKDGVPTAIWTACKDQESELEQLRAENAALKEKLE